MTPPIDAEGVRAALAAFLPGRTSETRTTTMGAGSADLEPGRHYLGAAVAGGWALPTWPPVHGGRGADRVQAALIAQLRQQFAVPDLYHFAVGIDIVGPTLLVHGTTVQQDRWLRRIASGAEIWCQLFSEPDAGSDLANVSTRAERDGDGWILRGQKVWTSRGPYSDWGICLTRTDPDRPKHQGLTMFAVPMKAAGVSVRPLVQMNGDRHFSETFFDAVRITDQERIGEVGAGWKVALTVLSFERAGGERSGPARDGTALRVPDWLSHLAASESLGDPVRRDRAMQLYAYELAAELTSQRAAAAISAGRTPGAEGSGEKMRAAHVAKQRANLLIDAEGAGGMLSRAEANVDFLTAPSMSIRGGTDEIQHNIVGERVLGLPAEPRTDRDASWSTTRLGLR